MDTATERSSTGLLGGPELSTLERVVIVLLGISALTHLYAGVVEGAPPVFLAGVGFVGGIVLYLRGVRRHTLTVAAVPFTAVQIPLWYVAKAGEYTAVGYLDKVVQVVLVVLLVVLALRQRREA
ncbi:hypothetical protein N0B31_14410 [Salinirubellus salinus]|uniref:Uncharacterized protein n=1 Tax=Salinirubellus salinus TaxID=1364945 RepID=A0A9E7U9L1_9EURY|nr:hypothetical protein [Salinirubellus salinus]UWM53328.1 hypothetical protein N0B31_14410 [Salinirubellus salinus]